jgi:hypothetical protein
MVATMSSRRNNEIEMRWMRKEVNAVDGEGIKNFKEKYLC